MLNPSIDILEGLNYFFKLFIIMKNDKLFYWDEYWNQLLDIGTLT